MKRRSFLRHATRSALIPPMLSGLGASAFSSSPLIKALYQNLEETDKVLVLIYLGGGNDGLNTVVPIDQFENLSNARPGVILPEDSLLRLDGEQNLKLHPSLTGFRDIFDDGNLGIIQSVGYPNQSYSHFRSTDIWMTAADAEEVIPTGWLGRYLNDEYPNYPVEYPNPQVPDPLAIEIGYNLSVAFQGPSTGMGMVVGDPDWFYQLVNNGDEPAPDTKVGDKLRYIRLITKQSQVYGEVIKNAAAKVTQQSDYPDNELAEQLKIVARLIAGGLQTRLYMVSLHGFDTHDSQVLPGDHTKGEHSNLLTSLGSSVKAFMKDLSYLGVQDRVLGSTISEFGRRIISNGSSGTDHGSAAPMFVFGENISGGIYGENPAIPAQASVEENLTMQFDFRTMYQTILQNWFCVDSQGLQSTFSQNFDTIPFIEGSPCMSTATHLVNQSAGKSMVKNFPNPFRDQTEIEFESSGDALQIRIMDLSGKHLQTLASGYYPQGKHQVIWNASDYPAATYYLNYQNTRIQQSKAMLKL